MSKEKTKGAACPVVYLGPDVPGRYRSGTTYTDGLPEALQSAADACPAIKSLIVPLAAVAGARATIERKAGPYPVLMAQARKYFEEEIHGNV